MGKKDTVLDDSASIYQKREPKSEKQKWSEMDKQARLTYFNEYYRSKMIWGIIGLIAVVSLLYSVFGPKVEQVLYAAVINDYWYEAGTNALQDDLELYLEADPEWEEVCFDDIFFFADDSSNEAYNYVQKLATYVFAGDVDLIIADEAQFEVYAMQDYFMPLDQVLPSDLYELVEEHLVTYKSDFDGQEYAVGIHLGASPVFQSLNSYQEDPLVGILANSEYQENAIETIRYFFTSDADYSNVEPIEE